MTAFYWVCKYWYLVHFKRETFSFDLFHQSHSWSHPALTNSRRVLLHACTHTQRQIHILTHKYLPTPSAPSLVKTGWRAVTFPCSEASLAVWSIIPLPLFTRKPERSKRRLKMATVRLEGSISLAAARGGWREGERKTERPGLWSREERRGEREGGAWITGSWDKMTLQGMTVLIIYDPQVSAGDCSNFSFLTTLLLCCKFIFIHFMRYHIVIT